MSELEQRLHEAETYLDELRHIYEDQKREIRELKGAYRETWTEFVCPHGHRWRSEDYSTRCPGCGTITFKQVGAA